MRTNLIALFVWILFLQYASFSQIEENKIIAGDGEGVDSFGYSVSIDGENAIVGSINSGSAYVFIHDGVSWAQQTKLTPSNGSPSFGRSVSISGDYIVVGAPEDTENGSFSGSVYIFQRNGNGWVEKSKINADDGDDYDEFGGSVSISGDYLIVGAQYDEDNGASSGSAYIYRRDNEVWVKETKTISSIAYPTFVFFGCSVSISGDYAIVGARGAGNDHGAVIIYKRNGDIWIEHAAIDNFGNRAGDRFGNSVAISGNYAVVGTPNSDEHGNASGTAYIFTRDNEIWIEQTKLTASDATADDIFGWSVSIAGDYCIIGAIEDDDNSGSAYIFVRDGETWMELAKLTASDGASWDYYGQAVSISDIYAIVGAKSDDDNGSNSGSAYILIQRQQTAIKQRIEFPDG